MLEQTFYQVKGVLLSERIPPWAEVDAYTRLEFVGSKADRPYGSFARGRPERVAEPGPPPGRERERIGTVVRRALPWGAALAAPALIAAIALAPVPAPVEARPSPTPIPAISEVYAKVAPSVVQIRSTKADGTTVDIGSGVVIDDAGDILTALHVIQNARDLSVVFADGTQSRAVIIAELAQNDIAAVRALNPSPLLVAATLGDPSRVRVGDDAIVVGNPYALTRSLSTGVVSGLNRSVQASGQGRSLSGLIQFDAAVNPGSSGGPLLNRDGDVVGIVTGLVNPTGSPAFSGIGFAVTIDTASAALGLPPE